MGKLLPIILIVLGGAIGGGAGVFLKPNPDSGCEDPMECDEAVVDPEMTEPAEDEDEKYYHSMKNQFVVPVIRDVGFKDGFAGSHPVCRRFHRK